jgi:hypothetical protein
MRTHIRPDFQLSGTENWVEFLGGDSHLDIYIYIDEWGCEEKMLETHPVGDCGTFCATERSV